MKKITLSNGAMTLVDDDNFERLSEYKWKQNSNGYVLRTGWNKELKKYEAVLMHRVIMSTPAGMHTDHINRDVLDNRKSNLRNATPSENNYNTRPLWSNNTSGYKGICWDKSRNKWLVRVGTKQVGRYDTLDEAIQTRQGIVPEVAMNIIAAIKETIDTEQPLAYTEA
jgi:hypothetical protein